MTDADDTSDECNHADMLGACPRLNQGEVQGLCHPSPGHHRGIAARATFSSLAAAPKGDGQSHHEAGYCPTSWGAVPEGGHRREGRQRHLSSPAEVRLRKGLPEFNQPMAALVRASPEDGNFPPRASQTNLSLMLLNCFKISIAPFLTFPPRDPRLGSQSLVSWLACLNFKWIWARK